MADDAATRWSATPLLAGDAAPEAAEAVHNPADPADIVGQVQSASAADVQAALAAAEAAAPAWAAEPPARRAAILDKAADALEAATEDLLPLLMREAGKTAGNAVAEVREAVDFLRYYAAELRRDFDNASHRPLGAVLCISPWNFPLAIFSGQIAAALAAGNVVLAKPAEQTPLVAAEAVRLLHAAGVPRGALQLLPGRGETVGAALVADARVQGVLFTGSTEVARLLQRTARRAPGRAWPAGAADRRNRRPERDDRRLVGAGRAGGAGRAELGLRQRRPALLGAARAVRAARRRRPRCCEMLVGAMHELRLGDPRRLATDVGPVIDDEARAGLRAPHRRHARQGLRR